MQEQIKKITLELLEKLELEIDWVEVIENTERKGNYDIKIKTPDSAILIWKHWNTFEDLKNILRNILKNISKERIWINLEINDYIAKKFDRVLDFVARKIEYVEQTWREVILPEYNWYERKKIHSYVASLEDPKIYTKSIWEWKERRMHIILKDWVEIQKKETTKTPEKTTLSIDLDWVWI
jgi:predicted RNA-binding protein Jag